MKRMFVGVVSVLFLFSLLAFSAWNSVTVAGSPLESFTQSPAELRTLLAYNIDLEMDKAREEKTVEHYGEGIRDIVQDANTNNVNNPDSKPTAENTYKREKSLIDALPNQIGKDFSKEDLAHMEHSDKDN
jgi:hypothetical protein